MLAVVCLFALPLRAQLPPNIRSPLGVFAHISVEDALKRYNGPTPATPGDYHTYLKSDLHRLARRSRDLRHHRRPALGPYPA